MVTPSIGIAIYPEHGQDAETLIKHADKAMYQAKRAGKNNYVVFDNVPQ
ncbi:diguanylate cyclase [Psychrobacillus glaciei]|uniref:Diguanylate cyclase n=1 Tax=Psychrobacillus glaciei TaxID=2283160 RepID=A0A5J6SK80_9BACI|nr:diguanylate cyclase [Psychrobacillus glaciei]